MEMLTSKPVFVPDACQQAVIEVREGYHMVLAPPGCGKTQILSERIRYAHDHHGIAYADMVCLTFTNRAARGMQERIAENIGSEGSTEVYVGNVHRFCSRFLFTNGLVPAESSVIDDDDAISILARYLDEDEYGVKGNARRRRSYAEVFHFSIFMHQIRQRHARHLRTHPECLTSDDVAALRRISEVQQTEFTPDFMTDVYDHVDVYRELTRSDAYDFGSQKIIRSLLRKMELAKQYENYKRDNLLLDFEDLLMLTYDALSAGSYPRYSWIQVDEVQDLSPIQLAIIDLITSQDDGHTVVYLGDEQQAIFSFMGAKMDTLQMLKIRCEGHIHYLNVNHRSPDYLLEVFNTYASQVLHIDEKLLPTSFSSSPEPSKEPAIEAPLRIVSSETFEAEMRNVCLLAQQFYQDEPDSTTAIIVNSNYDADQLSDELRQLPLPHFKVSGEDVFASPEIKLLLAHLNILSNEHNFIAWARLLKGLGVFEANASARNFVRASLNRAILPSDYIRYDNSTYVQQFVKTYDRRDLVVFDTETTGLSIFEDDIVQIAAVRMRQGSIVEGSEFCIYIDTDREIPRKLGDIDNPLIEALQHNVQVSHAEALRRFMTYVGDAVLVGHNADFDVHILISNLERYLGPEEAQSVAQMPCFDTLRLSRLLEPDLRAYKLKHLLEVLHLEGSNTHLADDDVQATVSVVRHCYGKALSIVDEQRKFMGERRVTSRVEVLRRRYSEYFFRAQSLLYRRDVSTVKPVLVSEMMYLYRRLCDDRLLEPLPSISYVERYLASDVIDATREPSLIEQLNRHIVELNTLKEADLCGSSTITDRVFLTTVHKAKGLEFDNVIVFDVADGRYPSYYSQQIPRLAAEDARKLYVAMSRARRRLTLAYSLTAVDRHNQTVPRELSRFLKPIGHFFDTQAL